MDLRAIALAIGSGTVAVFGQAQPAPVLLLRKDQRVWKGTDAGADVTEHGARHLAASPPQIDGGHRAPSSDDGIGETDLAIHTTSVQ